jgi:hypothetical protein
MNPKFLLNLSLDDLNQRYSNTFVLYDGVARSIKAFDYSMDDISRFVVYFDTNKFPLPFDPEKLSFSRPASGWYNEENPFYFGLKTERQYSRGLNNANSWTWYLSKPKPNFSPLKYVLENQKETCYDYRFDYLHSFDLKIAEANIIHRRHFLITKDRRILYRTCMLGQIFENKVTLIHPEFYQEIKEIFRFPTVLEKVKNERLADF